MTKKKILVVDFDEKSAESLRGFLEDEGFDALVACDGETGLDKAKQEKPDLVILEPMLPKLHGFELCGIITHDMDPKIPVIILTKFYREEQFKIESLRSFGASAFVSKPFERTEMRQLISDLIPGENGTGDELNGVEIPDTPVEDTLEELQSAESGLVPDPKAVRMMETKEAESKEMTAEEAGPEETEPKEIKPNELGTDPPESNEPEIEKPEINEPESGEFESGEPKSKDFDPEELKSKESDPKDIEPEGSEPENSQPQDQPPQVFQPRNLDKDFMESISDPESASPEPRLEDDFAQELDAMMQDAFSDFGLGGSAKKTSPLHADPSKTAAPPGETAPEPPVFESGSVDPEPKARPQDNVMQKLEAIARAGAPEPAKEASAPEELNEDSKENDASRAEAVAETMENELELKIKEVADQETEDAEPDALAEIPVEAQEAAADSALEKKSLHSELQEVVEEEDVFGTFGDDEEKSGSGFFKNILGRLKGVPTKIVVPMAAVFIIILVSLILILRPDESGESPAQQGSLGLTTIGQPLPGTGGAEDGQSSEENPPGEARSAQDLEGIDTSAEGSQGSASVPSEKPREDPAPPPSATPQVTAEIQEAELTPQLIGDRNPRSDSEDQPLITQQLPQNLAVSSAITDTSAAGITEITIPSTLTGQSEDSAPAAREASKIRQGDIVSIQLVDRQPEPIHKELPRFPPAARGRGVSGIVMINALISETGDVIQTVVIRRLDSPYGFNQVAENAVKKWKFSPAEKDGVRVKVWKAIPIAFSENMD